MTSFKFIGFIIYGHGSHLGHMTRIIVFEETFVPPSLRLLKKFGLDKQRGLVQMFKSTYQSDLAIWYLSVFMYSLKRSNVPAFIL